jgi:hypothetical protein
MERPTWKLIGHSYQCGPTGDYDGYYEITNGEMSILSKDDDDESLRPVVEVLNLSNCNFYLDNSLSIENYLLKQQIKMLKDMIENDIKTEEDYYEFLKQNRNAKI